MVSRPLMIATLLGASVGVPYAVSNRPGGSTVPGTGAPAAATSQNWSNWSLPWAAPAATLTDARPVTSSPATFGPPAPSSSPQLDRMQMHPVESVLRFDLTREWVYRSWDRKSTGPTDVGLSAVRVALVSGTDIGSLAGSLTYFFNELGAIEHITFRGRTGDPTRLANFLTRTYHFAHMPAPTGEQLYQVKVGDKVQSELRTRPEAVLSSATPHTSVAVELELARPGSPRFLPPRGTGLQVPPASATPAATDAPVPGGGDAAASSDITSSVKSYFDQARYATPAEESQMRWMRWPN